MGNNGKIESKIIYLLKLYRTLRLNELLRYFDKKSRVIKALDLLQESGVVYKLGEYYTLGKTDALLLEVLATFSKDSVEISGSFIKIYDVKGINFEVHHDYNVWELKELEINNDKFKAILRRSNERLSIKFTSIMLPYSALKLKLVPNFTPCCKGEATVLLFPLGHKLIFTDICEWEGVKAGIYYYCLDKSNPPIALPKE
jgi:hypothetical protein